MSNRARAVPNASGQRKNIARLQYDFLEFLHADRGELFPVALSHPGEGPFGSSVHPELGIRRRPGDGGPLRIAPDLLAFDLKRGGYTSVEMRVGPRVVRRKITIKTNPTRVIHPPPHVFTNR